MAADVVARDALVRRGQVLSRVTLAYNAAEGIAALAAGTVAGSIALIGFGIDSVIEVASSVTALWRLRADADHETRERTERVAVRIIGGSLLALALYVAIDATHALWTRETPRKTAAGVVIAALSVAIMPLLARAKRRVANALASRALSKDATQTDLCAYLSAILLGGLLLNAMFGWWWADPIAALAMSPIIAKEGLEAVRRKERCDQC